MSSVFNKKLKPILLVKENILKQNEDYKTN